MTTPGNGFIAYAREDRDRLNTFRTYLVALKRSRGVDFWADPEIPAGSNWEQEILRQIAVSDCFILLLSPHFIASDYIMEKELPAIRARRDVTHGLLLPVLLVDCSWWLAEAELQVVPTDKGRLKQIIDWRPHSKGYNRAHQQISAEIDRYYGAGATAGTTVR